MFEPKRPCPPDVLAKFHEALARLERSSGPAHAGAVLWPRYAAYHERLSTLPRRVRRRLQRRWRCSLAGLALLLALGQLPALAATITVDGTACRLIDAITAANTDNATAGCAAGGGADTIMLQAASVHTLTVVNNGASPDPYVYGPNGLPLISSDITIVGSGSTIARDTDDPNVPNFRILAVTSGGNLTVQETTISGGRAMQPPPQPPPPVPVPGVRNRGGGVFNAGTLSLVNSRVSESYARNRGGGIYNFGNASLVLTRSTISGNSARTLGGGISNSAVLTVMNSTVSGNTAGDEGGGLNSSGSGQSTVINSTILGNVSRPGGDDPDSIGGGISNSGVLQITNSTVFGNSAFDKGGGLYNNGAMTIASSTVSGNEAATGGGLYNVRSVTLMHTLLSGNVAGTSGPEAYNRFDGSVTAGNFNLLGQDGIQGVVGFTPAPPDLVPNVALNDIVSQQLLPRGGATRTLSLVEGSPAVDAIPVAACTETTDQRGAPRRQDGNGDTVAGCDIGAFELGQVPPPPPPPTPPGPQPPPESATEPLPLSDASPSGCEVAGDVITCGVPGSDARFILLTTDIPADGRFLQFEYTFSTGATSTVSAAGTRIAAGGLGAVFINGAPVAAFTPDSVQQAGVFQTSGQFGLPPSTRGRVTATVANYPLNGGSEFRVRNLRVDRCTELCFGRRATMCGTNGPDRLRDTNRKDVIVGRGGNDDIRGLGGNDRICGGAGNDKLSGGKGRDRLNGGLGRDRCDGGDGIDIARKCDRKSAVP